MRPSIVVASSLCWAAGCSGASSGTDVDASAPTPTPTTTISQTPSPAALRLIEAAVVRDDALVALVKPRSEALQRTKSGLVSEGFRAADARVFHELGLSLPERASGAIAVMRGQDARYGLRLELADGSTSTVVLDEGRAVYADALPGVDAVWASSAHRAELFFVVRKPSGPFAVDLRVTLGERITRIDGDDERGFRLLDDAGRTAIAIPKAFAIDATGQRRKVTMKLDRAHLTLSLDVTGLQAPIVVDPALEAPTWTLMAPATSPPVRFAAAMAYDSFRKKSVLFGGSGAGGRWCDTWEYTAGAASAWAAVGPSVPSPGSCPAGVPPLREFASMAYDATNKLTLLYGGQASALLGDFWKWDGTTWTQLCTSGACSTTNPGLRAAPQLAFDSARNVVVLFGGVNAGGYLCDTWEWNGATSVWTQKQPNTNCGTTQPVAVFGGGFAYDSKRGVSVLFGGENSSGKGEGTVWEYNGTAWAKKTPGAPVPVARRYVSMVFDSARGRSVLFGGQTEPSNFLGQDTWDWDGTAWKQWTTAPVPNWRFETAAAFDQKAGRFVMFGGSVGASATATSGTRSQETWEFHTYGAACTLGTECDSGICEDNVCCETACAACHRCDAAGSVGSCTAPASAITNAEDTSGALCSGTSYCNAGGTCVAKVVKGGACTTAGGGGFMCATGNCYLTSPTAGVCCDTACTGGCQGCTAAETGGATGTCANVSAGGKRTDTTATVALCTAGSATTSCGNDGTCNGAGACRKWSTSTLCIPSSCPSETTEKKPSFCDGSGACAATAATSCAAGYACVSGACKTACTVDTDCASTHYCTGGACVVKKTNGTTCVAGNECSSGQCPTQDKVCCDTACSGTCEACTGAKKGSGSDGTCGAIADGGDPDSECPEPPAFACASAAGMGVCDGAKKCRAFAKSGTACAAGTTCTAGEQTGKACDGAGNCIAGSVTKCSPYKCDAAGSVCLAKCTVDADCSDAKLFFCDKLGLCQPRKANGADCGDANECAVGASCADKVCCDTTCTGQCESCAEAATKGTCTAVTGDPRPGHTSCTGDKASGCAGTCDGKNRAACFYDVGKECDATCASNKATISKCDGTGACKAEPAAACNGYKCTADGKRCGISCTTNDDCEGTYRCDTNKCVPIAAKCSADLSGVDDGTGKVTPCGTYKCRGAKCLETCTSTDDCVTGNVCDGNKCIPAPSTNTDPTGGGDDSGGCGCSVPRGGNPMAGIVGTAFLLLIGLRRRRR